MYRKIGRSLAANELQKQKNPEEVEKLPSLMSCTCNLCWLTTSIFHGCMMRTSLHKCAGRAEENKRPWRAKEKERQTQSEQKNQLYVTGGCAQNTIARARDMVQTKAGPFLLPPQRLFFVTLAGCNNMSKDLCCERVVQRKTAGP